MANDHYLVCMALLNQNGKRRLPIGGASLAEPIAADADPGQQGEALALDLLLRLWQQTNLGPIQRHGEETNLLLLEMPMAKVLEDLPRLKKAWLAGGSDADLYRELRQLTERGWSIQTAKYSKPSFQIW